MPRIISGCPMLESLALYYCGVFQFLDLRKSLSLTRLEIKHCSWASRPTKIIAPHIHYLRLKTSETCKLVDVSSLSEAYLDIGIYERFNRKADLLLATVLKMLAKLRNVERLTVSTTVLQILSAAEIRRFPFRALRVQTLIVKTQLARSLITGIAWLLQNSPDLKRLIVQTTDKGSMWVDECVDSYLDTQGSKLDKLWRLKYGAFPPSREMYSMLHSEDSTWKLLASFIECLLRNTKTLETLVIWLGAFHNESHDWAK
ncbi:unnamed protein product [Eruca vesicaria subsp. sativa]|uniref:F-box protein n=1 Tax=Eruca vesicaria subsp. sativa TaxID=29727 RepID=A0ABC8J7B7_ERUVS|nr:unnamed protein product [Eruca vesicaria subsp. sativa]